MTLAEFLKDRGMTQKSLADKLGVTAGMISGINVGNWGASQKLRYKFAEVFPGYDVDEFELTPEERAERQRNRKDGSLNSRLAIPAIEVEPEPEAEKAEEERKPVRLGHVRAETTKVWMLLGRHDGLAMLFSSREAAVLHLGKMMLDDESQGYTLSEQPIRG